MLEEVIHVNTTTSTLISWWRRCGEVFEVINAHVDEDAAKRITPYAYWQQRREVVLSGGA
jgi:hypothetical protein